MSWTSCGDQGIARAKLPQRDLQRPQRPCHSHNSSNDAFVVKLRLRTLPGYNDEYTYDTIGNLTSKTGVGAYAYTTTAGLCAAGTPATKPHAVAQAGSTTYVYDCNGNLTSGAGRIIAWDSEHRPSTVQHVSGSETYTYDADGERVTKVKGSTTTYYLGGLWEEDSTGASKAYYSFNGQVVAMRTASGVTYLHGDHLGSVSASTNSSGALVSQQAFDPWGTVRSGGIGQTDRNYTGQRLDMTELLYYHARMYDPVLARFASADSVVPGSASGGMDGIALRPLTVDFHEPGFASGLSQENGQPFWFQMNDKQRQKAGSPWGPANPQALNRYSYVRNNPLRYTDPTGHTWYLPPGDAARFADEFETSVNNVDRDGNIAIGGIGATLATLGGILADASAGGLIAIMFFGEYMVKEAAVRDATNLIKQIRAMNGAKGVAIAAYKESGKSVISVAIMNRETGETSVIEISLTSAAILPEGTYIGTPHGNWSDPGYVFAHDFDK